MGEVKLSILIPTVYGREAELNNLLTTIAKGTANTQMISVSIAKDNKEISIGQKREQLYKSARGKYSWMLDDDDSIAPNAIELILKAIDENLDVDCITFEEKVLINGEEYRSNFSNKYADWVGDGNSEFFDGFHFQRTVFYKCVIKTELAKQVPFKPLRFGEDHEWAKDLKPLIQTEYHIPEQLYHYIHNSKPQDFNERYGFDKQ